MTSKKITHPILAVLISMLSMLIVFPMSNSPVYAEGKKTVIELWEDIKAPAPVELKAVKIDSKETAFLILDIEELTCNAERRPRCVSSVSDIRGFLEKARSKGMAVVYSLTNKGTKETILPEVTPLENEPIVKSSVDKFFNTDIEKILLEKGIKTVIISGTTAEGAVLHTATGAAMRGFRVIVPIEGMSAGTLYAEQYTAWHLLNAPGTRQSTTLTSFEMIEF